MGYPTVDAYLARLPAGLASYPDVCCKGVVLRQFMEGHPFGVEPDPRLPPELAALLKRPPALVSWQPLVHLHALMLARQAHHQQSDQAFVDWSYDVGRKLVAHPLARLYLMVISPDQLLQNVTTRWGSFQKGTKMTSQALSRTASLVTFTFPPDVYPEVLLRATMPNFRAALEGAGAKDVRIELLEFSAVQARFQLSWSL
jgi:hypothetical protein